MKLNMHTAETQPDWENIPDAQHNVFQKVAARTNGWVTIGNIISVTGAGLVIKGLRDIHKGKPLQGTLELGAGRVCDLVDGFFADITGTKSPKGAKIDASLDQLGMVCAIPVLQSAGVLTSTERNILFAEAAVSTLANLTATSNGREIHTGWTGKRSTFAKWLGMGTGALAVISASNGHDAFVPALETVSDLSLKAGLVVGAIASIGYAEQSGLLPSISAHTISTEQPA